MEEEKLETYIRAPKYGFEEYIKVIDKVDINDCNTMYKRSFLHEAIVDEKWDVASDLIDRGIDVNIQDELGFTALYFAVERPYNEEIIEKLLKAGADPLLRSDDGRFPLYIVSGSTNNIFKENGAKYRTMELLLKYGADKNMEYRGMSSVEVANITEDQKALEILEKY